MVHAFAGLEDRNKQLAHRIGARSQVSLFPGLDGIKQQQGLVFVVNLICQTDQVGDYLAVVLSVDAMCLKDRALRLPGFVTFSVFSDSLIFGINFPVSLSLIAASL